jgi:hypothetical protein
VALYDVPAHRRPLARQECEITLETARGGFYAGKATAERVEGDGTYVLLEGCGGCSSSPPRTQPKAAAGCPRAAPRRAPTGCVRRRSRSMVPAAASSRRQLSQPRSSVH